MMWRNPNFVPEAYQSTAMDVVEVLVVVPGNRHPVPGYYIAVLKQWRVTGSPSAQEVTDWQPMPPMPVRRKA